MKYDGERLIPGLPGLQRLEMEHLTRYEWAAQFVEGKAVVDCGCGVGYGSALLAKVAASVIGFDYSEDAIEDASSTYGDSDKLEFRVGNLEDDDFVIPACDVVVLFEVIEHLKSPGPFLQKVVDAIRPGGVFLFSTPNFRRHSREGERHNEHHHHDFREEDLSAILAPHFEHVVVLPQSVLIASSIGSTPQVAATGNLAAEDHMFLVGVASLEPLLNVDSWLRVEPDRITPLLSVKLREERTAKEAYKARAIESATVASKSSESLTNIKRELEALRRNEQRALAEGAKSIAHVAATRSELEQANSAVDQLRAQVGQLRAQVEQQGVRGSAIEAKRQALRSDLLAQRAKYARLRNRRSVRLALALASKLYFLRRFPGLRPLYRLVTRRPVVPSVRAKPSAPRWTERTLEAQLRRSRPASDAVNSGMVSIIVPTRDGLHHMERLIGGLRLRTDYRNFELVVVDNASSDGTGDWVAQVSEFPVKLIRNERNESFSRACNQGAASAAGDYLLFLNNDVDPINASWLSEMVATLDQHENVGAVGALLVYPESQDDESTEMELTVQHRGIAYTWHKGRPRAVNLGRGEDPTNESFARTYEVPSVTAACMLVPRGVFDEVGQFDEAYVYGTEDVDLNLAIRQSGHSVYFCGRAALFHHESASQDLLGSGVVRVNRITNAQVFVDRWSPALSRTLRLDGIAAVSRWADPVRSQRRVAITLTRNDATLGWGDYYTAHELGDAFARAGWEVFYAERYQDRWYEIPDDIGLVISLLDTFDVRKAPSSAVTVAWIRNWTDRWLERPWVDEYDVLVPSSLGSADLIEHRFGRTSSIIPLASNPARFHPGPMNPTYACDFVFTGNFWGQGREVINRLIVDSGERFLIFGKNWDKVPRVQRFWRGFVDYDSLPDIYRSAAITIDDTAGPTLPYGAVNSRVFDALASGSLVLTDNQAGNAELFEGLLPTYSNREDLRDLLDTYLTDETARSALVDRLRSIVLASHTYDKRVDDFLSVVDTELRRPRVALKIGAPNWDVAESWGDTHFARHFAAALRRHGFRTDIDVLSEWDAEGHQDSDVVVHLRGLTSYVPKPSQVNVLWIISHPEDISPREVERYDLVLVASSKFAAHLAALVDVPVVVFHQATDIGHFFPRGAEPKLQSDVLYVGNSRKARRTGVSHLLELGLKFDLYGDDWDGIVPPEYLRGFMPNEQLPVLYSSCDILVNDHWADMSEWGFISNRLFDALASGTFVLSDQVDGMSEAFDGAVPTYESRSSLGELIAHFRNDSEAREALASKGKAIVRDRHTFDARAEQFQTLITPLLAGHRFEVVEISGSHGQPVGGNPEDDRSDRTTQGHGG